MEQLISILVNNKSTTLMFFMISFAILNVTSLHKYSVESTVRLMTEKMEILPRTLFFFGRKRMTGKAARCQQDLRLVWRNRSKQKVLWNNLTMFACGRLVNHNNGSVHLTYQLL
jgi:hypothetical protein